MPAAPDVPAAGAAVAGAAAAAAVPPLPKRPVGPPVVAGACEAEPKRPPPEPNISCCLCYLLGVCLLL